LSLNKITNAHLDKIDVYFDAIKYFSILKVLSVLCIFPLKPLFLPTRQEVDLVNVSILEIHND